MSIYTYPESSVLVKWKDEIGEHCNVQFSAENPPSEEFKIQCQKAMKEVLPKGVPNINQAQ